jgi:acetyl/propionyl-CoA carboxylase alpha subunit
VLLAVEPVGPGVRVDAGVTTGDEVTLHYDPMIAKLIVLGENRDDAIGKMQWALRHYVILGDVITNIAFLRTVLGHPRFLAGDTTTDFVDTEFGEGRGARGDADGDSMSDVQSLIPNLQSPISQSPDLAFAVAALAEMLQTAPTPVVGDGTAESDPFSPWRRGDGFRLGSTKGQGV